MQVTEELLQIWAYASELTTGAIQICLNNYAMKARGCSDAFPPQALPGDAEEEPFAAYLDFGSRLAGQVSLGEVTLTVQATGRVTDGAWLDTNDPVPLIERLQSTNFPLDATYLSW